MPAGNRVASAVRDLLLVIIVAVAGLVLGALAAGIPTETTVVAPLETPLSRPRIVAVGTPPRAIGGAASTGQDELPLSTPVRHQPAVFPYSGQPGSGNRVDLRLELAQMADARRRALPTPVQP